MTVQTVQAVFDQFLIDTKTKPNPAYRIDPQAALLVSQGYRPVLTGDVPEWAFVERLGYIERQQWADRKALDGQLAPGIGWEAIKGSSVGMSAIFTMRLLIARGPLPARQQIDLVFWAMRNFPESWAAHTKALVESLVSTPATGKDNSIAISMAEKLLAELKR